MVGQHPIQYGNGQVGTAFVTKEGLFYTIRCSCQAQEQIPYRIEAVWADKTEDLGICAATEDGIGLTVRFSSKRLPSGIPVFRLSVKNRAQLDDFIPISPEEPFRYIERLINARFERNGDQCGILLPRLQ